MYKAVKNFAYRGRTYLEGEKVPQKVAETLGKEFAIRDKPLKTEGEE